MLSHDRHALTLNKFRDLWVQLMPGLASLVFALSVTPDAYAAVLRIRGQSSLQGVRVLAAADGLRVVGTLRDESGAAIAGASVAVSDSRLLPCASVSATTSADGEFCFMTKGSSPNEATLAFAGNDYFGPDSHTFALAVRPVALDLTIELPSERLKLARDDHLIAVSVTGDVSADEEFEVQLSLLRLSGAPQQLGEPRAASSNTPAQFRVAGEALGACGPAKLVATAAQGDERLAEESLEVLLVSTVQLAWEHAPESASPSEGFDSVIAVSDERGAVDEGFVEMMVGEVVVGMGEVANGSAKVSSRFLPPRVDSLALHARYVSSESWRVPGAPITRQLRVLPPSPWQHLPWAALVVLATLWVIRAWHRPPSRQDERPGTTSSRPLTGVEVLASSRGQTGWVGHVIDSHTLDPIASARVTLRVPAVGGSDAIWTETDSSGAFALRSPGKLPEGTRLHVAARHHSNLAQTVPSQGTLRIALSARRRTLLSHLVSWARTMGEPWESGVATTPAAVAQEARSGGQGAIQRWATKLEEAAYGPEDVSAATEDELLSATPPLDRPDPLQR